MKRKLENLANSLYDLVIIGGGIYGACIAWDAALRGLTVGLVEKSDFGSGTSANSLKIIHGGFRYVQHGNLKRMRELARERQTWMRIAPHLIHPLPVVIPVYGRCGWAKAMLSAALLANDLISLDRNRLQDPEKYIPRGKVLSKRGCLELVPDIPRAELTGGAVFYDAQVYNTERLLLSFLRSAAEAGAALANYVEVTRLIRTGNRVLGVEVRDAVTGGRFDIRAKTIVTACGPWLDLILPNGSSTKATNGYAKAINLVTRSLFRNYAVGIPGINGYRDPDALVRKKSPLLFVSPWHDHSLIGTRYAPHYGMPDDFRISETDVREFLDEINLSLPAANLKPEDVSLVHGGLLPTTNTYFKSGTVELSKKYKILDHRDLGMEGILSVTGVKYTSARLVAEKVVDKIFAAKTKTTPRSFTAVTPIHGGKIERFESFVRAEVDRKQSGLTESTVRQLIYNYGSAYPEVLKYLDRGGEYETSNEDLAVLRAETLHGVRDEMAQKLSDVILRRTEVGTAGHPGNETLKTCADIMSAELAWSPSKTLQELQETNDIFSLTQ
jgi:glycerol-3-phosphate dehydrogenase